jgi:nicotinate-nucleotide--dimethylbenzimidazole phosphoribosyltransferase
MNNKFKEIIGNIPSIDNTIMKETFNHFDRLAKPQKSLGKLEEIVARAAGIYGKLSPSIERKTIFLMAADHGVTNEAVSAYPSEITYQMVLNFLKGGAAINVLARCFGVDIVITDIGVKGDLSERVGVVQKKIAPGTSNMAKGPAMTREMAERAIETGIEVFEQAFTKKEIDLIGLGEMGIGNTTAASAIISLLTDSKVEDVTDCGAGLAEKAIQHKIEVIKKAISLNQPKSDDPIDVLAKVGGLEIGGLIGCIFAAAKKRIPIVMDGIISGSCALLAVKLDPVIREYLFTSHCSREKGHKIALDFLDMSPIFDLKMHLGEGTGSIFGMNFLESGFKLLNEMAAFDDLSIFE